MLVGKGELSISREIYESMVDRARRGPPPYDPPVRLMWERALLKRELDDAEHSVLGGSRLHPAAGELPLHRPEGDGGGTAIPAPAGTFPRPSQDDAEEMADLEAALALIEEERALERYQMVLERDQERSPKESARYRRW